MPWWFNFANSIWWSKVPKALYRSIKTPQAIFPSSRAFLIFSVILIKVWDVEYCCLNPNCKSQFGAFKFTHFSYPALTLWYKAFFNRYLAAPQPTLGHYRGDSLTHLMLVTVFYIFDPKVTRNLITRFGP